MRQHLCSKRALQSPVARPSLTSPSGRSGVQMPRPTELCSPAISAAGSTAMYSGWPLLNSDRGDSWEANLAGAQSSRLLPNVTFHVPLFPHLPHCSNLPLQDQPSYRALVFERRWDWFLWVLEELGSLCFLSGRFLLRRSLCLLSWHAFFFFFLAWLARQTDVNYVSVHKMAMIMLICLKDIFITIRRGVRDLCNNK